MLVFNRHVSGRGVTLFGFETVLIVSAILAAGYLHGVLVAPTNLVQVVVITAICTLCFYYNDLYDLTVIHTRIELVFRILQGAGLAAIALGVFTALMPAVLGNGGIPLTALGMLVVGIPLWRMMFEGLSNERHFKERVIILGAGPMAQIVASQIRRQHAFGYRLVGFVDDGGGRPGDAPILGTPSEIATILSTHHVDRIVVALADGRGKLPTRELLQAKLAGIRVEEGATTYERITGKVLLDQLKPSWLIFSDDFRASRLTRALKRMLDFAASGIGLVLALPLTALTALALRLDSQGPILYRQERVGLGGRVFTLFKFRSMRVDAESGTPVWACSNDARVTRVGRFIRLTRLDEIPQLWNVLRGDMSFVGPRPERPFFVARLSAEIPLYDERHTVRPGITGWAQVRYHYGASIEDATEKLRYDLYYIKHLSVAFDLTILVDTVKVILSRKGAQ